MFRDPERFIQEKLSKKVLSANTVRDAMMASFILTLQKMEEAAGHPISDPLSWREAKAGEMRKAAGEAFAAIGAPFEYPTLSQVERVEAELERRFGWDRIDPPLRREHERICRSLFSKFE
ncbi:MAG TPA: hypothetical protein VI382_03105 [Candidatus Manganitrophaceae bacterium]|nr:hypothetical protein [Candidatus Manganitrophaceae bacterium]